MSLQTIRKIMKMSIAIKKKSVTLLCFGCRVASSYSMDVIGRTIFSLQLDTEQEQNHIFVQKARKLFDAGLFSPMLFIMCRVFFFYLNPIDPKDLPSNTRYSPGFPQILSRFPQHLEHISKLKSYLQTPIYQNQRAFHWL